MTTIQIDEEANALVIERISQEKQAATRQGKPTKSISKNNLVSNILKRALRRKPTQKGTDTEAKSQ